MTDKEAIEIIGKVPVSLNYEGSLVEIKKAFEVVKNAVEEREKYKAIGTVRQVEDFIADWRKYRELGTLEEFKTLKEKNEPKKVDEDDCCPICHTYGKDDNGVAGDYCPECGQKLDWGMKEEDMTHTINETIENDAYLWSCKCPICGKKLKRGSEERTFYCEQCGSHLHQRAFTEEELDDASFQRRMDDYED